MKTRIKWGNVIRAACVLTAMTVCCGVVATTLKETFATDPISHVQEEGFVEYQIPTDFAREGGQLDARVQRRAWYACHGANVDYPTVLAIIEAETGYKNDAISKSGAVGYMQVIPSWHGERIERMHADVSNPVDNIIIGIDYLSELQTHCKDENYLLMSYNMGLSEATRLWKSGVYSTEYSRYIIKRSKEIRSELEGAYL